MTEYVIDEHKYSGYDIRFDWQGTFFRGNEFGANCKIFGVDMSSCPHVDNKTNDILILAEGPTQGLDCTTLTAKKVFNQLYWK